jgi:tetratricopeptide (TPR) repeat protein
LNLSFRGFEPAERAYRRAIELRPEAYDAHLGLAVAIHGAAAKERSDFDERIAEAARHIEIAKRIDPDRPEAWFNEGRLYQNAGGRDLDATLASLERARIAYDRFLSRAERNGTLADHVTRAREGLAEIDATRRFLTP